jgi:hypothetical protein
MNSESVANKPLVLVVSLLEPFTVIDSSFLFIKLVLSYRMFCVAI